MNERRKRVDIVKIKMCKEGSVLYSPRKITSPSDVVGLVKYILDDTDREEFIVVALDTKNQPIAVNVCSVGTINASIVHPREVFKMAVLANAASILVAHNHPSGDTKPSAEDIAITKRLKEAGDIMGIKIVDHIIIGYNSYMSFKEENII